MKIRTLYLKVANMAEATTFWAAFLGFDPHKKSDFWTEFKCSNINLGLLKMDGFETAKSKSNCVPVFELEDDSFEVYVDRAKSLNARVVVDIEQHPDKKSYVFADPFGNEFEVTKFHD